MGDMIKWRVGLEQQRRLTVEEEEPLNCGVQEARECGVHFIESSHVLHRCTREKHKTSGVLFCLFLASFSSGLKCTDVFDPNSPLRNNQPLIFCSV